MPTTYYAIARELTSAGGVSLAGGTWTRGQPLVERVKRALRTPRGAFLPDPTFGLDLALVRRAAPAARPAALKAAVRDALARFVRAGDLTDLAVDAEALGTRLFYTVSFRDARTGERVEPVEGIA